MDTCSKPRREQFKLAIGELAEQFGDNFGFTILEDYVDKISDGRELSFFLAQKNDSNIHKWVST